MKYVEIIDGIKYIGIEKSNQEDLLLSGLLSERIKNKIIYNISYEEGAYIYYCDSEVIEYLTKSQYIFNYDDIKMKHNELKDSALKYKERKNNLIKNYAPHTEIIKTDMLAKEYERVLEGKNYATKEETKKQEGKAIPLLITLSMLMLIISELAENELMKDSHELFKTVTFVLNLTIIGLNETYILYYLGKIGILKNETERLPLPKEKN